MGRCCAVSTLSGASHPDRAGFDDPVVDSCEADGSQELICEITAAAALSERQGPPPGLYIRSTEVGQRYVAQGVRRPDLGPGALPGAGIRPDAEGEGFTADVDPQARLVARSGGYAEVSGLELSG